MDLRVRDKKTGIVRTVTHKAYAALGPKVYEKLGPAEAESQPDSKPVNEPEATLTATETEQPEQDITQDAPDAPAPKRRGRPAKDKSISSDSTEDEK